MLPLAAIYLSLLFPALAVAQAPAGGSGVTGETPARSGVPARAAPPAGQELRGYTLPPERAAKAIAYATARRRVYWLDFAWSLLVLLLVLRLRVAVTFCGWAEGVSRNRILQAILFVPLLLGLLEVAGLPAAVARHWLAFDYGISIQGWPSWFLDWVKGLLLQLIVGILLVSLLYAAMRRSPRRWWFYGWLASLPVLVFAVFISPWLVDPLFFSFTPLAPGHPELARQIERVTVRAGQEIPESRMYVMNASSKLTAMNAYVTGLGASRRVVVWDTTIARLAEPEVLSVFSHEMGHYVLGHVRNGVIFAAAMLLLGLFAASRVFGWMVNRWGAFWGLRGIDDWASLPALLMVSSVLSFLVAPAANAYSRHIEHQADQYGLEVLHGIVPDASGASARSLQVMGEEGLEEPSPSPAVVFWFYTHPPINDRIIFARTYNPWAPGHSPAFVK